MKISAIIINYNTPEITARAIDSLLSGGGSAVEMILIENGSAERVPAEIISRHQIRLIDNPVNLGFAKAVNQGLLAASGDYIMLLNSDVEISFAAVREMINYLQANPQVAIIGPRLNFPDGRWQASAGRFPGFVSEFLFLTKLDRIFSGGRLIRKQYGRPTVVDWLSGGCMIFGRGLTKEIGLLDESYYFGIEDVDFCWQAKKIGRQVIYYPEALAVHAHSASMKKIGPGAVAKRVGFDRQGISHYFKKNFPQSWLGSLVLDRLYAIKIFLLKSINR